MPTTVIETTVEVPDSRINDLLCSAFEGGSTYWCAKARLAKGNDWPAEIEYCHELPMAGRYVKLTTHNPEDDPKPHLIGRERCAAALQLMAANHPKHFADLLNEDDDADTGDAFLQLAAFGEVVFG